MGTAMRQPWLVVAAVAVSACTSLSEPSTTTRLPTVAPVTAATAIPDRSSTTVTGFPLDDLTLELGGVTYTAPSAVCGGDEATIRSAVDQLLSRAERNLGNLASGWPTTTVAPDSEELTASIDHDAVVAAAIAIRSGRGGIVRQRWFDANERYAGFEGATAGPLSNERISGWERTADALAEVLDTACP
jgi:hypothetical protein